MSLYTKLVTVLFALYVALTVINAGAAGVPAVPAGCVIVGTTSEGFPVAECSLGELIYADMDGAGGYASGYPVIEPGTWRSLEGGSQP
jgi:hypothetical protein